LGVSAEQVASAPQITPFLKDSGGSLKRILEIMRFSEDPVVRCFLSKRDLMGVWACENICWEAIALGAGLDLYHLLGAVLMAMRKHSLNIGTLIALSRFPEIIEKRIEYAKLPGGWRDREAIDELLGVLPIN
jgi:hypothetical protein